MGVATCNHRRIRRSSTRGGTVRSTAPLIFGALTRATRPSQFSTFSLTFRTSWVTRHLPSELLSLDRVLESGLAVYVSGTGFLALRTEAMFRRDNIFRRAYACLRNNPAGSALQTVPVSAARCATALPGCVTTSTAFLRLLGGSLSLFSPDRF